MTREPDEPLHGRASGSSEPTRGEGWLRAGDGTRLHLWSWGPAAPPASRLAVVHGVGEHGERYTGLATRLARRGIAVHALDQRGHGLSGGPAAHVDRWERYLEDLDRFLARIGDEPPTGAPVFLLGHSMGSLIVLEHAIELEHGARLRPRAGPPLAGLITSGVALDPSGVAKPWKVAAARLLSRLAPRLSLDLGISGERLSRDPAVARAYDDDPRVRSRASARWGAEALGAIARVRAGASSIRLPLLALHGADDPVAPVEGSRWLIGAVGGDDALLEILPGGLHEPHNDLCRERVAGIVADWIAARTPNWASAPGAVE